MLIAYAAPLTDPATFGSMVEQDSQRVLSTLLLTHLPLLTQAIFFGAVLSAIMSCSSATLLAPFGDFCRERDPGLYAADE